MAWLRLNRHGTSLNVATFQVGKPGSGSVLSGRGLGPGTGFASLTTLGSRVTLIPPSDGIVRPMMLSHRRVRCKTLRPHDCPLALISLSPKRVPPLGAFSFAERKAHGNTTMVERPRRSRALVGCSERVLAVENGPQSLSLTAANKRTIPRFFTTAS